MKCDLDYYTNQIEGVAGANEKSTYITDGKIYRC